jgi:hypothetical protein
LSFSARHLALCFAEKVRDSGRLPICLLPHPLATLRTQTSCTRDPNSNLVFFHLPSYLTCPFLPLPKKVMIEFPFLFLALAHF